MTNENIVEILRRIKEKVMRMPLDCDFLAMLRVSKHSEEHTKPLECFLDLWFWIWERKKSCEVTDLAFLLRVLRCDACCRSLRESPSDMADCIRQNPAVQEWFSEQKNRLTGMLALAEDAGDKLRVELINLLLSKLERQLRGEIL